jgi:hypothetical protein
MRQKTFSILGIDQTGAVSKNGTPKPLAACMIAHGTVAFRYLDGLNLNSIHATFPELVGTPLQICVDCVLGLPSVIGISWRSAVKMTARFQGYGRKPASDFFRHLGNGRSPKREVERICRANSIFQERPFQKNIQTGTYRLWKDLAQNLENFYVPALENRTASNQVSLTEGYPSMSWRQLFQTKGRQPENLRELIRSHKIPFEISTSQQKQIAKDHNFADAYVLAAALTFAHSRTSEIIKFRGPEGWILGADQEVAANS